MARAASETKRERERKEGEKKEMQKECTHLNHDTKDSRQVRAQQQAINRQNQARKRTHFSQPSNFTVGSNDQHRNLETVVSNDRRVNESQRLGDDLRSGLQR